MAARATLKHRSVYEYSKPVSLGPHLVRLRPAPHAPQRVLDYALTIAPAHDLHWQQDPFGCWQARVTFPEKTQTLSVEVTLRVARVAVNPFAFALDPEAAQMPFAYAPTLADALAPCLAVGEIGEKLAGYLETCPRAGATVAILVALNQKLHADHVYEQREEEGVQTPEETIARAAGSCRDLAWLFVTIARRLGVAARFVSGYFIPWDKENHGEAELHAWAEAYLPGAGWVGFDPTSGLLAADGHAPLAAAAHYADASPITGTAEAAAARLSFSIEVAIEAEAGAIGDDDWAALNAVARQIDADIAAQDMRLTLGGEPTFVAASDPDAPEWNVAATGPTKQSYADAMIRKLRDRFAPGGALHYGQGKWYPGEELPRWAYTLFWRRDGAPIWKDAARIARMDAPPATREDAERFIHALARALGVDDGFVLRAFESPAYWLEQEHNLPHNIAPGDPRLSEAGARAGMARVFARGLDQPTGFVLPLARSKRDAPEALWFSEAWTTRRDAFALLPGTAPIGHRLPLAALPVLDDYPDTSPADPTETRGALPKAPKRPKKLKAPEEPVRTAIAVEAREGKLCVFLPPVARAEHYLELLAAIETAAEGEDLALHIEGYPPPFDPRLASLSVTPDPGVIEVNVHPGASWEACAAITEGVYEDAESVGLRAEKFLYDGRRMGTGGGNHIVLGAASPTDSPFLRRPDVLKSILIYWQRHPSLSYLFSGQYVGPSSQSPRIDEARHEALYELEIALAAIDSRGGEVVQPWLVDRLLRNLLVDASGNTHRAEICIDKLYSPESSTGRLGLVEFRAFEMPPDARQSLAQQALIRALVTWFWRAPQDAPLIRWGAQLHDRFMLSQFVWNDFLGVLADLNGAGYAFDADWFAPLRTFRFPLLGQTAIEGVELSLRHALEPWHVMGEEGAGAARWVDSSIARVEISAQGFDPRRHVLACNGRAVPLAQAGDGHAAGVRFKAWKLARGLHPTKEVDAPLTFMLHDALSGRALGGFTYHVLSQRPTPPGAPLTAADADARREARFEPIAAFGQAPAPEARNADYPMTLDLRRPKGL